MHDRRPPAAGGRTDLAFLWRPALNLCTVLKEFIMISKPWMNWQAPVHAYVYMYIVQRQATIESNASLTLVHASAADGTYCVDPFSNLPDAVL